MLKNEPDLCYIYVYIGEKRHKLPGRGVCWLPWSERSEMSGLICVACIWDFRKAVVWCG